MKNRLFSVLTVLICIVLLSSCSSDVLKTDVITDELTQTPVIKESKLEDNSDYNKFLIDFEPGFTVPGLFEGFIPQGICFDDVLDAFIISGYFEDGEYPSMLCVVDINSGRLLKSVSLKTVSGDDYSLHAGGIAAENGNIYVVSGYEVNVLSSAALKMAGNGSSVSFESNFKSITRGSFASIANNTLYIGDFIESSKSARDEVENITTLESGETFYAYCEAYILEDGLPAVSKINSSGDGYIPDYMLAVPEQVQGITVTPAKSFVFSISYGRRNDSAIMIFDDVLNSSRVGSVTVDGNEVDLFACSADLLNKTYVAPPMAESVVFAEGSVYLLFESGAAKYRNGGGKYSSDTVFYADFN